MVCQGLGAPAGLASPDQPHTPGSPISAQPGVCQATDPAEPDPIHGLVAQPAPGPAPRPASPHSALAPLYNFHFCMLLVRNGGMDLFFPDLTFFPYKAQTFRAGCLVARSGQILLNGAF